MSLFSDTDIEHSLQSGRIKLDPSNHTLIQPSSIDVRLDGEFLVWDELDRFTPIDPREPQRMIPVSRGKNEPFRLLPGQFVLGSTVERLTLAGDVAARLEGKSSLGRLGLLTHATAGFIDPGFTGHITLELKNLNDERPIMLWPGMAIGQLCFFSLRSACVTPYGDERGSHYQDQDGPTPSRAYEQFAQVKPTTRRPSWMAPALQTIGGAPL